MTLLMEVAGNLDNFSATEREQKDLEKEYSFLTGEENALMTRFKRMRDEVDSWDDWLGHRFT